MTTFTDGPAKGQCLMLRNAPRFLRVTQSQSGDFDALDAPNDSPHPGESLFAYELNSKPSFAFIDFRGKARSASGRYPIASYRLCDPQPVPIQLQDNGFWSNWCAIHAGKNPRPDLA